MPHCQDKVEFLAFRAVGPSAGFIASVQSVVGTLECRPIALDFDFFSRNWVFRLPISH
jgi:hypothetical protein